MPDTHSHVFALPFDIMSKTQDGRDLTTQALRDRLLECLFQMSDEDLQMALQKCDTSLIEESPPVFPPVDQEKLGHDYPLHDWFKAIDKGETRSGYLEWQLQQERQRNQAF